jgi:hypothetical protein
MSRLSIDLLLKITSTLSANEWKQQDLEELIDPRFGMMTGFPQLLEGGKRVTLLATREDLAPASTKLR